MMNLSKGRGFLAVLLFVVTGLLSLPAVAQERIPWPSLSTAPQMERVGEDDVAIIVAIEDYVFLPNVPGAVENANDWENFFRRGLGMRNVYVLTNRDATREAMVRFARQAAYSDDVGDVAGGVDVLAEGAVAGEVGSAGAFVGICRGSAGGEFMTGVCGEMAAGVRVVDVAAADVDAAATVTLVVAVAEAPAGVIASVGSGVRATGAQCQEGRQGCWRQGECGRGTKKKAEGSTVHQGLR